MNPPPSRAAAAAGHRVVVPSAAVVALSVGVGVLAAVAAVVGLFWTGGDAPGAVRSVRGVQVELYGEGLYRFDSVFKGAGNRGTDLVTLVVGLPLLWWAVRWYRRGAVAGALLLAGALSWFVYVYASLALGSAYNELFLAYVALVSAGSAALLLTVRPLHPERLVLDERNSLPRRSLSALLLVAGTLTAFVWLQPIVAAALLGSAPPLLLHSTTLVTEVMDLAVVVPLSVLTGLLLLRHRWRALVLAVPLLVLLVVLACAIVAQSVAQLRAGWEFTVPELVGPIGGFLLMGSVAAWLLVRTLIVLAGGAGVPASPS